MADVDLKTAIQALANHLQRVFKNDELAETPEAIWKPLRKPTEVLTPAILRPLYKIFDTPKQNNGIRLNPHSFAAIFSIIVHADSSPVQQRVLHKLIEAVRICQDKASLLHALQVQKIKPADDNSISEHRQSINTRLFRVVCRVITNARANIETRCTAAQLCAILVKHKSEADRFSKEYDCRDFGTILYQSEDWILRYLVSDVIRQLLYHGIDAKLLWPRDTALPIIETFPTEEYCTSEWLFNVRGYFSDLDTSTAFNGSRQPSFWATEISRYHSSEASQQHVDCKDAVLILTKQVRCLIAADALGIRLLEYPLLPSDMLTSKPTSEEQVTSTTMKLEYKADQGYVICNGGKTSLTGLTIDLASVDEVAAVLGEIGHAQKQLANVNANEEDALEDHPAVQRKTSIGFVDLDDTDNDGSDGDTRNVVASGGDTQMIDSVPEGHKNGLPGHDLGQVLSQFIEQDETEDASLQVAQVAQVAQMNEDPTATQMPATKKGTKGNATKSFLAALVRSQTTGDTTATSTSANDMAHNADSPEKTGDGRGAELPLTQTRSSKRKSQVMQANSQDRPKSGVRTSKVQVEDSQSQSKVKARATNKAQELQTVGSNEPESVSTSFPSEVQPIQQSTTNRLKQKPKTSLNKVVERPMKVPQNNHSDVNRDVESMNAYEMPEDDLDNESPPAKKRKTAKAEVDKERTAAMSQHQRFKKQPAPAKSKFNSKSQPATATEKTLASTRPKRNTRARTQQPLLDTNDEDTDSVLSGGEKSSRVPVKANAKSGTKGTSKKSVVKSRATSHKTAQREEESLEGSAAAPIDFSNDSSPEPPQVAAENDGTATGNDIGNRADFTSAEEARSRTDAPDVDVTDNAGGKWDSAAGRSIEVALNAQAYNEYTPARTTRSIGVLEASAVEAGQPITPFGDKEGFLKSVNNASTAITGQKSGAVKADDVVSTKETRHVKNRTQQPAEDKSKPAYTTPQQIRQRSAARQSLPTKPKEEKSKRGRNSAFHHATQHAGEAEAIADAAELEGPYSEASKAVSTSVAPTSAAKQAKRSGRRSTIEKRDRASAGRGKQSSNEKSPVVHFGLAGPANQGSATQKTATAISKTKNALSTAVKTAPARPTPDTVPAESEEHDDTSKALSKATSTTELTPSRPSLRCRSQSTGDHTANPLQHTEEPDSPDQEDVDDDDGILVLGDEPRPAIQLATPDAEERLADAEEPSEGLEPSAVKPVAVLDEVNHVESADTRPFALGTAHMDDTAMSREEMEEHIEDKDSGSPESEDGDASEYEQSEDSAMQSSAADESTNTTRTSINLSAVDNRTKSLPHSNALPMHSDRARQSIGVSAFLEESRPAAAKSITTGPFRQEEPSVLSQKPSRLKAIDAPRAPPSAAPYASIDPDLRQKLPVDRRDGQRNLKDTMPPPASKVRKGLLPQSSTKEVDMAVMADLEVASFQTQNPVRDYKPRRVLPERDTRMIADVSPREPEGTPAPYHSKLEEDILKNRVEEADFVDNIDDPTLVDTSRPVGGAFGPVPHAWPRNLHNASASSADGSSVLDEGESCGHKTDRELWRDRVRGAHQGFLDTVLDITTNVLFKLGVEEDAVLAKTTEYKNGGDVVMKELRTSWTSRMDHERAIFHKSLTDAQSKINQIREQCESEVTIDGESLFNALNLPALQNSVSEKEKTMDALLKEFASR